MQKAISAKRAATLLGIKPATLYAYVSRGLITPVGKDTRRQSLFRMSDVEKLKARSRARAGRGAVAADALRWGDPVLDSSITKITKDGPAYRGHLAVGLAEDDVPFENVCELLWSGVLPDQPVVWPHGGHRPEGLPASQSESPLTFANVFVEMMSMTAEQAALEDPARDVLIDEHYSAARRLISDLTRSFSYKFSGGRLHKPDHTVAGALAVAANKNFALAKRVINRSLVLCADHELTASTFVARIAASTGASPFAAVSSAFGAMSGTQHGAHFHVVREQLTQLRHMTERQRKKSWEEGALLGGFHHTLYPEGDPRSLPLMQLCAETADYSDDMRFMLKLVKEANGLGIVLPTIDLALLMVCSLLEISDAFASVLFGIGRMAGLFAQYQEQRMSGFLVRPRARYSGR